MTIILPERLAQLDTIHLDRGAHGSWDEGHCVNEVSAWLAGEPHSDKASCVSPALRSYTMRLNDRWSDEQRQVLTPYAARIVGTAGDGLDGARRALATEAVPGLLGPWLRLAGLDAAATSLVGLTGTALRQQLRVVENETWQASMAARERLRVKILERLRQRPAAAAVAAAAAAVAAAADADAAADVAAAAVAAAADPGESAYRAARKFWDDWFANSPDAQNIRDLGARQRGAALDLLDAMIKPGSVSA